MNLENEFSQLGEDMYEINKFDIIKLILPLLLLLVFIQFFSLAIVSGPSMEPALVENNILLGSKVSNNYDIGNIVFIKFEEEFLVKRVAAKEGDMIEIINNQLYINFLPIEDCYINCTISYFTGIIPKDTYYVLGDNMYNSCDSRYFGLVYKNDIFAKKIFNFNKDFLLLFKHILKTTLIKN